MAVTSMGWWYDVTFVHHSVPKRCTAVTSMGWWVMSLSCITLFQSDAQQSLLWVDEWCHVRTSLCSKVMHGSHFYGLMSDVTFVHHSVPKRCTAVTSMGWWVMSLSYITLFQSDTWQSLLWVDEWCHFHASLCSKVMHAVTSMGWWVMSLSYITLFQSDARQSLLWVDEWCHVRTSLCSKAMHGSHFYGLMSDVTFVHHSVPKWYMAVTSMGWWVMSRSYITLFQSDARQSLLWVDEWCHFRASLCSKVMHGSHFYGLMMRCHFCASLCCTAVTSMGWWVMSRSYITLFQSDAWQSLLWVDEWCHFRTSLCSKAMHGSHFYVLMSDVTFVHHSVPKRCTAVTSMGWWYDVTFVHHSVPKRCTAVTSMGWWVMSLSYITLFQSDARQSLLWVDEWCHVRTSLCSKAMHGSHFMGWWVMSLSYITLFQSDTWQSLLWVDEWCHVRTSLCSKVMHGSHFYGLMNDVTFVHHSVPKWCTAVTSMGWWVMSLSYITLFQSDAWQSLLLVDEWCHFHASLCSKVMHGSHFYWLMMWCHFF